MRTDILDLHQFYASPLGTLCRELIAARLKNRFAEAGQARFAGFGHTEPYLSDIQDAERVLALDPGGQGVIHWPAGEKNRAALVENARWPLPDASIDCLLIAHGLEEASDPRKLMREAWRVLTDSGRVIIVAAHRRGIWSTIDTTPFAAGRPYLKRQLELLLRETMFEPQFWNGALHFPPFGARFLLRAAPAWERAGAKLWPGFAGVILVEATKSMALPVAQVAVQRASRATPIAARPALNNGSPRDG